jgi:hypothetical protein
MIDQECPVKILKHIDERKRVKITPALPITTYSSQLLAAWSQIFRLLAFDVVESGFESISQP